MIIHSDRGSQYTSSEFLEELLTIGMIPSLSCSHHCYDNARIESFFAMLKKEGKVVSDSDASYDEE